MDLRIFLGIVIFSISMNLIGGAFGVGDLEQKTDFDSIRNETDFSSPDFTSEGNDTFDAIQGVASGVGDIWNIIGEGFNVIIDFLLLAIPSRTGVLWFDTLIFGPIIFAFTLGVLNFFRGK